MLEAVFWLVLLYMLCMYVLFCWMSLVLGFLNAGRPAEIAVGVGGNGSTSRRITQQRWWGGRALSGTVVTRERQRQRQGARWARSRRRRKDSTSRRLLLLLLLQSGRTNSLAQSCRCLSVIQIQSTWKKKTETDKDITIDINKWAVCCFSYSSTIRLVCLLV